MKDVKVYDGSGWQSLKGPPGPSAVSADAGNDLRLGSDALLYSPYRGLDYLYLGKNEPPSPVPSDQSVYQYPFFWMNTANGSLHYYRSEGLESGEPVPASWEPVLDSPRAFFAQLEDEQSYYYQARYISSLTGDATFIINPSSGPQISSALLGLPFPAGPALTGGDPWTFLGKALGTDGSGGHSLVPVTIRTGEDWLTIHNDAGLYIEAVEITYTRDQ
jgi:hypothetical protein